MIKVGVAIASIKAGSAELQMYKADTYTGSLDGEMIYAITDKWHGIVMTWYGDVIVPVKMETQVSDFCGGKLIDITAFYKGGGRVNAMVLATEVSE